MAATSVTGLSGPGSAMGQHRGPGNGRNMYVPLVGPHVVAAGTVTAAGSVATVQLALPNSKDDYVIILSYEKAAVSTAPVVTARNDTDNKFTSFVIATTAATDKVHYMVVKAGV